ncbi:MAG: ATP-dependent helicase [Streptosporangiales bacterium]|nr:ATP-dependent helicase [Streptosporangiales bacterium]
MQAVFRPGGWVPADGHLALWGGQDPAAGAAELGLPDGRGDRLRTVLPASRRARRKVVAAEVAAHLVPIRSAVRALAALPPPDAWPSWQRPGDSVLAWSVAAKLALEHVAAGHVVPVLRPAGPGYGVGHWRLAASDDGRLAALARTMPAAAHALARDEDDGTVWPADELLAAFCDAVADACARPADGDAGCADRTDRTRRTGSVEGRWAAALTGTDSAVELPEEGLAGELARWAAPLTRRDREAAARLCVQLHTPEDDAPDASWPLVYHLQAADDPSLMVPADDVWATGAASMRVLGREVGDPQESLVRGLAEAARLFPPIDESLSEPRPVALALDPAQAAGFLTDGAGALAAAGLGVLLPAELTAKGARRLRARLRVGTTAADPGAGITGAGLTAENLTRFGWEAAIGDETLTADEFAEIAALKQPLVRWRGHWVRLDAGEMPKLARLVGTTGTLSGSDALSVALAGQRETAELGDVEVVADGSLRDLTDRLRSAGADREPRLAGIDATLRDYQLRGVAWLQTMGELGLGGLLADDMGLGKTVQTISLLADRASDRPQLVVCPTSVVGNWERELARFAPSLPVVRHHGSSRPSQPEEFKPGAVVVSSYGLLRRDVDLLAAVDWDVVVLDEAQQIKNHAAQGAKAARRLSAAVRVALTGTPIENRLSELWSIMDFANPGLLGPFARFRERYAVPVERWRDPDATARLRRIVAPFMLRRLKTDVAAELPPKVESIVACTLTREQATLYQATVSALLDEEGLGEGIERRGRILKLLTELKQICNHPAQYLDEPGPLSGRSGKLARVTEMLAETVAADDRALVFTQYREMGELLVRHLARALRLPEIPFLHGGVARSTRDRMVEAFQAGTGAPILIVSLKAGGTGLNLTGATHVVHYDRWWNPAVEDQATDRAYRIGQTRTVNVHKLVTRGTLEERIADLLEQKRALADAVVGTGETWLTELNDDELRALVELSADDRAPDPVDDLVGEEGA